MTDRKTTEELQSTLSAAMADVEPMTTWRHNKSGAEYMVTGLSFDEESMAVLVTYEGYRLESVPFTRKLVNFTERFSLIK